MKDKCKIIFMHDEVKILSHIYNKTIDKENENWYDELLHTFFNSTQSMIDYVLKLVNVVIKINIDTDYTFDYIEFLEVSRGLNIVSNKKATLVENKNKKFGKLKGDQTIYRLEDYTVLISGSVYNFKQVFKNIKNGNNKILNIIKESLYRLPKEYFTDFIQDGIMSYNNFFFMDTYEAIKETNSIIDSEMDILNIDNIYLLYYTLEEKFSYDDLMDIATITIKFKGESEYKLYTFREFIRLLLKYENTITKAEYVSNLIDLFMTFNSELGDLGKYVMPKYIFSDINYNVDNSIDEAIEDIKETIINEEEMIDDIDNWIV